MARFRKTQTKVTLNAKISNVDLQTIAYDGTSAFIEGAPVMFGANGNAAKPTATSTTTDEIVYVNFVDSTRSDVLDTQGDPFQDDLATLALGASGHLTGIRGSGIDIGLPAACWTDGVLPAIGEGVFVGTNGDLFDTEAIAAAGVEVVAAYYGIIERIAAGRAHFFFTSRAIIAAVSAT